VEIYEHVIDKYVGRIVEILTFIILAFLVAMIFASVLSRYVFNFSLAWAEELAGLFFVWLTLLGSVTAVRKRTHMAIAYLVQIMAPEKQRWMNVYIHSTIVFFLIIMVWKGTEIFLATIKDYSAVLRIPIGLYYLSLPLCGILMFLFSSRDIIRLLWTKAVVEVSDGKEE
jgi:TRAP-type C4-dicarboxylate transport system permease small subunit